MLDKINFFIKKINTKDSKKTAPQYITFQNKNDEFVKTESSVDSQTNKSIVFNLIRNAYAYKDSLLRIISGESWGTDDYIIGFVYQNAKPLNIIVRDYDYDMEEWSEEEYTFEEFSKVIEAVKNNLLNADPEKKEEFEELYSKLDAKMQEYANNLKKD